MTNEPALSGPRRAAVVAIIAASVILVVGSVLFVRGSSSRPDTGLILSAGAMMPAFLIPGLMIARRRPDNALGWVLAIVGLFFGLLMLAGASGSLEPDSPRTGWRLAFHLATAGVWAPPIFVLLSVVPLIFPDGRLPSPRWRWVVGLGIAGTAFTVFGVPFSPEATEPFPNPHENAFLGGIGMAGPPIALSAILLAMVGMVKRYRRARGVERDQMKLFVSAVVFAVIAMVTNAVLINIYAEDLPTVVEAGLLILSAAVLSVSIGIAILQHGLFDINVVISRALVYGVLAVVVTGLYIAIVVGVGAIVGRGGEQNLGLSVVATAVAALAFQPLRVRAQRLADRLAYGARATPYEALARLTDRMADEFASEDLLIRTAAALSEGTGASVVRVWLRIGDELQVAASNPSGADPGAVSLDGETLPTMGAHHAIPVRHQAELLGAITIDEKPGAPLGETELRLANNLASQAGLVLRNARLTAELLARLEELRASRQRLVKAQDEERRRIERDLHDGAQQMLVALKVEAGLAAQISGEDNVREMLKQMAAHTGEALETIRDLARGIYPPLLASDGLAPALRSQAAKAQIPTTVEAEGLDRYPPEVEAAAYFCCLEAMQNAAKYSEASSVTVTMSQQEGTLRFEVSDDGRGFDPPSTPVGSGTQNMRDRVAVLDGALEIRSAPGSGTRVSGRLPHAPPRP